MTQKLSSVLSITVSLMTVLALSAIALVFHERPMPRQTRLFHWSAPEAQDLDPKDETLGSPFTRYESSSFSYSVRVPSEWKADLSHKASSGDRYVNKEDNIFLTIGSTRVPEDTTLDELDTTLRNARLFASDSTLHDVETLLWKDHATVSMMTTRSVGETVWVTREYHVLRPEHSDVLSITMSVTREIEKQCEEEVAGVMEELEV